MGKSQWAIIENEFYRLISHATVWVALFSSVKTMENLECVFNCLRLLLDLHISISLSHSHLSCLCCLSFVSIWNANKPPRIGLLNSPTQSSHNVYVMESVHQMLEHLYVTSFKYTALHSHSFQLFAPFVFVSMPTNNFN